MVKLHSCKGGGGGGGGVFNHLSSFCKHKFIENRLNKVICAMPIETKRDRKLLTDIKFLKSLLIWLYFFN